MKIELILKNPMSIKQHIIDIIEMISERKKKNNSLIESIYEFCEELLSLTINSQLSPTFVRIPFAKQQIFLNFSNEIILISQIPKCDYVTLITANFLPTNCLTDKLIKKSKFSDLTKLIHAVQIISVKVDYNSIINHLIYLFQEPLYISLTDFMTQIFNELNIKSQFIQNECDYEKEIEFLITSMENSVDSLENILNLFEDEENGNQEMNSQTGRVGLFLAEIQQKLILNDIFQSKIAFFKQMVCLILLIHSFNTENSLKLTELFKKSLILLKFYSLIDFIAQEPLVSDLAEEDSLFSLKESSQWNGKILKNNSILVNFLCTSVKINFNFHQTASSLIYSVKYSNSQMCDSLFYYNLLIFLDSTNQINSLNLILSLLFDSCELFSCPFDFQIIISFFKARNLMKMKLFSESKQIFLQICHSLSAQPTESLNLNILLQENKVSLGISDYSSQMEMFLYSANHLISCSAYKEAIEILESSLPLISLNEEKPQTSLSDTIYHLMFTAALAFGDEQKIFLLPQMIKDNGKKKEAILAICQMKIQNKAFSFPINHSEILKETENILLNELKNGAFDDFDEKRKNIFDFLISILLKQKKIKFAMKMAFKEFHRNLNKIENCLYSLKEIQNLLNYLILIKCLMSLSPEADRWIAVTVDESEGRTLQAYDLKDIEMKFILISSVKALLPQMVNVKELLSSECFDCNIRKDIIIGLVRNDCHSVAEKVIEGNLELKEIFIKELILSSEKRKNMNILEFYLKKENSLSLYSVCIKELLNFKKYLTALPDWMVTPFIEKNAIDFLTAILTKHSLYNYSLTLLKPFLIQKTKTIHSGVTKAFSQNVPFDKIISVIEKSTVSKQEKREIENVLDLYYEKVKRATIDLQTE